jgi:hypothetical protein
MQVIQNVASTTISGVYATFYLAAGAIGRQMTKNPTAKSFRRAISWSFGSVCFGSLLIALVQWARSMLHRSRDRNGLGEAIADCLLGITENVLQYFNYYAFVHVAIYGKPYMQAAKDVWHMLQTNGVMLIINDDIIGTFCFMASLCISCGSALLSIAVMTFLLHQAEEVAIAAFYVCLLGGAAVSYLVLVILRSGATTTLVCLAEAVIAHYSIIIIPGQAFAGPS